jgi:adenylate cyclase
MFADIEGFTRLSEHMAPEAVVDFLNEFMTAMTEVIEAHDGVVDKFMGDGIMAVFLGGEEGSRHHAARAVQTAIEMQRRIGELRRGWTQTRPTVAHSRIRVGVNTGKVVAGNIGSRTRMDYTVIGDNANVAARLETAAGSGEVLISRATYLSAGDVEAQEMPPLPVKNRQQPVLVYKLRLDF